MTDPSAPPEPFDYTYAASHLRDVAGLDVFPADSSWPARLREIADMLDKLNHLPSPPKDAP